MVKRALHPPAFSHLMSGPGPGCVKTPTSNFRVEILSRLRWIGKELLCQSSPKEEKGENNSAHSLLAHVFTQPRSPGRREGRRFDARGVEAQCPSNAISVRTGTSMARNFAAPPRSGRSEERRVGKECKSRWTPYH